VNTNAKERSSASITEVLAIVDRVVAQMSHHLSSRVSAEDLASAGKLAVMEIMRKFGGALDDNRGYLVSRVRGALFDEMRRLDPLSRYGRGQVRRVRMAVAQLEETLNRVPTDTEVAGETGLSASEVRQFSQLGEIADAARCGGLDDGGDALREVPDLNALSPADLAEESDCAATIRAALATLSSSQSEVLMGYYFENLNLQAISAKMGISVVRVHQLRLAGEERLRSNLHLRTFQDCL
jgi:RNA polymerase sigma factor for flagellar operon FliA